MDSDWLTPKQTEFYWWTWGWAVTAADWISRCRYHVTAAGAGACVVTCSVCVELRLHWDQSLFVLSQTTACGAVVTQQRLLLLPQLLHKHRQTGSSSAASSANLNVSDVRRQSKHIVESKFASLQAALGFIFLSRLSFVSSLFGCVTLDVVWRSTRILCWSKSSYILM